MKYLAVLIIITAACRPGGGRPPKTVCSEQHAWETHHLPHHALSPVIVDESEHYTPDVMAWNDLDTPIKLRISGAGFRIVYEEGGDADSGWLGLATARVGSDGHMTACTVTMNHTLLQSMPPGASDAVSCQEIGHCLGLDHSEAKDTCMFTCVGEGWRECLADVAKSTPGPHDAEQLDEMYEHAVRGDSSSGPNCVGPIVLDAYEAPVRDAGSAR